MVAVALEQQAALAGRAGRVKAGDGLIVGAQHAVLGVDGEAALGVHEHRAHGAERDVGAARRASADCRPSRCAEHRLGRATPAGMPSLAASSASVGAAVNTSGRLRR